MQVIIIVQKVSWLVGEWWGVKGKVTWMSEELGMGWIVGFSVSGCI